MRLIHSIAGLALLFFLLLFGAAGINQSFLGLEPFQSYVSELLGDSVTLLRVSVLVITLTLVYLLSFYKGKSKDSHLEFSTDSGTVEVSLNAASNYLSRLKKEFAAVVSLDPKLKVKGNGLCVLMKTGIKSGTRIPELSSLIQQRARQCLAEDLGLENIVDIRIAISEISGPPPAPDGDKSVKQTDDAGEQSASLGNSAIV